MNDHPVPWFIPTQVLIFCHSLKVLIYVFDVESRELEKDIHYYQTCLESLLALSENAKVFCLVHKMDLIQEDQRSLMFDERAEQLKKLSLPLQVRNSNREFPPDRNRNRESFIQLI